MRALLLALAFAGLAAASVAEEKPAPPSIEEAASRLMEQAQQLAGEDPRRARALMEEAAATGFAEAINGLAAFVGNGIGGEPDPEGARKLIEEAAAKGSVGARLSLAMSLLADEDEAAHARAVALLESLYTASPNPAANPGAKAIAAGGLGTAYIFGRGVKQDIARGVTLLEECDAAGYAFDQVHFLLGRAYESGWGGRKPDPEKAYEHFWSLANSGDPRAQWRVAMALLAGSGVELNEPEAYRWARKAAEAGLVEGQLSTAVMLALGQGVEENDPEAREWYTRAANAGSAHGLRGLGAMLLQGEGGERDAARGWAYITLAADAGEPTAKRAAEAFGSDVSESEKARAKAIAAEWVKEHGTPRHEE